MKTMTRLLAPLTMIALALCMLGCSTDTPQTVDATVSFVAIPDSYPATIIDFSPSTALPAGVTYRLTDDKGHTWNSASGFNGQVFASTYETGGNVIFTQTFYLNNVEITGANSKRTVNMGVNIFPSTAFSSKVSDSGAVTLKHP